MILRLNDNVNLLIADDIWMIETKPPLFFPVAFSHSVLWSAEWNADQCISLHNSFLELLENFFQETYQQDILYSIGCSWYDHTWRSKALFGWMHTGADTISHHTVPLWSRVKCWPWSCSSTRILLSGCQLLVLQQILIWVVGIKLKLVSYQMCNAICLYRGACIWQFSSQYDIKSIHVCIELWDQKLPKSLYVSLCILMTRAYTFPPMTFCAVLGPKIHAYQKIF